MQTNLFEKNNDKSFDNIKIPKIKDWTKNEILMNEFLSIGFYMSDHPLKTYENYLKQFKITSFEDFKNSEENNGVIAGTIMSIQEKEYKR